MNVNRRVELSVMLRQAEVTLGWSTRATSLGRNRRARLSGRISPSPRSFFTTRPFGGSAKNKAGEPEIVRRRKIRRFGLCGSYRTRNGVGTSATSNSGRLRPATARRPAPPPPRTTSPSLWQQSPTCPRDRPLLKQRWVLAPMGQPRLSAYRRLVLRGWPMRLCDRPSCSSTVPE